MPGLFTVPGPGNVTWGLADGSGVQECRVPASLSAIVAWLPFNAHLAFYGSYWSSVGSRKYVLAIAAKDSG